MGDVPVLLGPMLEQLSVPQVQPLWQQPPPRLAAQADQPVWQLPEAVVVATPVAATATVTPELTRVIDAVDGQSDVAQSLPTRQHPPA